MRPEEVQRGSQSARCNEGHLIYTPFGADSGTSFFSRFNINTIDAEFVIRPCCVY